MTTPPLDSVRRVLADALVGRPSALAAVVDADGVDAVFAAAQAEGVVVALHAALPVATTGALQAVLVREARTLAARSLLCVSQARAIQQALDGEGIPCLWLKGVALGQWLYPQPHLRELADLDLLLPDHATALRAAAALAPLGYVLPNPHIAGDLVVHELLAVSDRARLELDLHWGLSNDALFADRLPWSGLLAEALPLPGLGVGARGLSPVHAFLHACMHRACNALTGREDRLRWVYDIHLLAIRFDDEDWRRVHQQAVASSLADACASALQASTRLFATPVPHAVLRQLEVAASGESMRTARLGSWAYYQLSNWRRLPTLRSRLRWLRQLLFPEMAHLRVRYGMDGAGAVTVSARRLLDGVARWRGYARRRPS